MMIARVVVDKTTVRYDKIYDYCVPDRMEASLRPGCRVMAPFGRGDRPRLALVVELIKGDPAPGTKTLSAQADAQPVLSEEGIALLHYLKRQTYCRYFEALSALIPPGIGMSLYRVAELVKPLPDPLPPLGEDAAGLLTFLAKHRKAVPVAGILEKSGLENAAPALDELVSAGLCTLSDTVRQKSGNRTEVWVSLTGEEPQKSPTPKQQQLLDLLAQAGEMPLGEAMAIAGVGRSVVAKLEQHGAAFLSERPAVIEGYRPEAEPLAMPVLSAHQQAAADALAALTGGHKPETALLYGVTGSGKTSVYLHLIRQVVNSGRQVIVLVPEIALTPQAVEMFFGHFGPDTAVIHSSLSATERIEAYERIRSGQVKIVVGTRSAVFAPLQNIGLIVIDEEQEHTYHSESAPRYHAKEVAALRCRRHNGLLLLASATPAVESYDAAQNGRIHLVSLTERYAGAVLPEVHTIDLRDAPLAGQTTSVTEELSAELTYNLDRGEQSILLLNRRGYHTLVKCSACGEAVKCPHCEVAMTYHAVGKKLLCHYCGYQRPAQGACDTCGSELVRYTGLGTQRVQEEIASLFPEARILRMDADTTGSRYAHQKAFGAFAAGEYDIMVGTQMVAKGLNFPCVTLVGVLLADQSFYADDFRSYEKSFSLITQVVGRCGRGELPGRAYIQTYTPENRIVPLAAAQDYPGFFRDEIVFRKVGLYPPFCDLLLVGFSGEVQKDVEAASRRFADTMAALAAARYADLPLRVLGPAPFAVPKVAGRWRSRILIKCRRGPRLTELLTILHTDFFADRKNEGVLCYIDPYCDGL